MTRAHPTHSKIPPRSLTVPYDPLWPRKPDFPDGGEIDLFSLPKDIHVSTI
jgi:hypothetical protein